MTDQDSIAYASQGRFHRSLVCPRTGHRVSFALLGDWDEATTDIDGIKAPLPQCLHIALFLPPSGCSRYMGLLLDGIAREAGLAMLAVDRPATGAVPMVDGRKRMSTSTDNLISVLEALGVSQVHILTHSAGWFYALELMRRVPHLVTHSSRIVFSSPFVPTHISSSTLSLLPASVVRLAPAANSLLNSCGKALTWSAGVRDQIGLPKLGSFSSSAEQSARKNADKKAASKARNPHAKFHPPYTPTLPDERLNLILKYFNAEDGVTAAVQDFLFCLGKAPHASSQELETWMEERLVLLANAASVTIIWGQEDFMTPQKGRTHLKAAMEKRDVKLEEWVMAQAGHDETTASQEVMGEAFKHLRGGSNNAVS